MSPLGKVFLYLYLNVITNCPIISKFLEQMLTGSHTSKDPNIAQVTLANLESVPEEDVRSRQDIYLLTCHPNAGNALSNTF